MRRRLTWWLCVLGVLASLLVATPTNAAPAARVAPVGPPSPALRVHVAVSGPLVIETLGDSITAHCGDTPPAGYCAELGALLDQAGIVHIFVNRAVAGTDCGYTSSNIATWLAADHPGLVLLDCGTNNAPSTQADEDLMGAQWRTIVETVHNAGILQAGSYIGYSDPEINAAAGRSWLVPGEINAQDVIWSWYTYEIVRPGWSGAAGFAGWADFSTIPGNRTYLGDAPDGIHPIPLGYKVMGDLWYRALRVSMGWPDIAPAPCGMWGHKPIAGAAVPAYTACVATS